MNVLRQFLRDRDLQQREFAERMGYTEQYISDLINGRVPVTTAFMGRVLVHYGADAASLFFPYVGSTLTNSAIKVDS